jgi:methylglutaconyl-CoA hydratase
MEFVKYSVEQRIATVILSRPAKRNALNNQFVRELDETFAKIDKDKRTKVVIIKAEGDVFCAGADLEYLKRLQQNTFEENLEDSTQLKNLFYRIYQSDKIVIAQMHGHAIAGGAGIITLCDYVFASNQVKIGYTEVKIGFIPAIVTLFLIKKAGEGRAKQLLLSGDLIDAETAVNFGLVYKVVEANELESSVLNFAKKLVSDNSGESMKMTKQLIHKVQKMNEEEALDYAAKLNAKARESKDCRKGIEAFLDKKNIEW